MDSHLGQWVLVITISFEPGLTKEPSYDQGLLKLIKKQSAKKVFYFRDIAFVYFSILPLLRNLPEEKFRERQFWEEKNSAIAK